MAYGDPEYLFHKYEMFGVMEGHRQKASQLVQQMAGNTLLNTPAEDIVADIFAIDVEGANSTAHALSQLCIQIWDKHIADGI